jgi:hypothetical protein
VLVREGRQQHEKQLESRDSSMSRESHCEREQEQERVGRLRSSLKVNSSSLLSTDTMREAYREEVSTVVMSTSEKRILPRHDMLPFSHPSSQEPVRKSATKVTGKDTSQAVTREQLRITVPRRGRVLRLNVASERVSKAENIYQILLMSNKHTHIQTY